MVHVDFKPDGGLAAALSAPVTEVATFFHDGAPPEGHEANVAKFRENAEKHEAAKDILGVAYGTTYEEVEKDGVKGKAAVLAIGWPSVEVHMALRQTQFFKDNIALLRNDAKGIEVHHTNFMNFVAD